MTSKQQQFLINLYQTIFTQNHDNHYENGIPRMSCLKNHMDIANMKLYEPFSAQEMPELYTIVKTLLDKHDKYNKPCMSIAMAIDIMIENDTIDVIQLYQA